MDEFRDFNDDLEPIFGVQQYLDVEMEKFIMDCCISDKLTKDMNTGCNDKILECFEGADDTSYTSTPTVKCCQDLKDYKFNTDLEDYEELNLLCNPSSTDGTADSSASTVDSTETTSAETASGTNWVLIIGILFGSMAFIALINLLYTLS